MKQDNNYEKIEKYLNNKLSKEDKMLFEKAMELDTSLALKVRVHQDIESTVKDEITGDFQKTFPDIFDKAVNEIESNENATTDPKKDNLQPKIKEINYILYANINYSNQALLDMQYQKLALSSNNTVSRDINDTTVDKDVFGKGINAIKEKKWEEALIFFEKIPNDGTLMDETQLYLAFINYEMENYDKVLKYLERIQPSSNIEVKHKAQWIQIQTMLSLDVTNQEFQNLLHEVAIEEGHLFKKQAIELKHDLNSFWRKMAN